jgi:hypothetical protein
MSRHRWRLLALVLAGALALTSGGVALARQQVGPLDGDWMLIQAEDEIGSFAVENAGISLIVRGQSVTGYAACGDYRRRLTGEPAALAFETPARTMEAREQCPPQLEEARELYLAALAATDRATLEGRTLRLLGEHIHLVFLAIPPFPEAQLAGTAWVLESFGETWSRQQVSPRVGTSTLRFLAGDRFTATLACGRTVGFYRVGRTEATTVSYDVVGPGTGAGSALCPRAAAIQDLRVAELLRGFRASVQGDRLILTRNRLQVVYRAAAGPGGD